MICESRTCENEVPEERRNVGSSFCSPECRKREKSKRQPSHRRKAANRKRSHGKPFDEFLAAADRKQMRPVSDDPDMQRQARTLVGAGAVAYENREGLIRDIARPRAQQFAGRVFSKKAQLEASEQAS